MTKLSGTVAFKDVSFWVVEKLLLFRNFLNPYGFLIKLLVLTSEGNLIFGCFLLA